MDELMEPEEVAKLLKVNRRTIIRWAEQKRLPGFKLGDLWRFRRETIEEYIRQLERGEVDGSLLEGNNQDKATES